MKKILFCILIILTLFSCENPKYNVSVGKTIISADDEYGRDFKAGDSVCIYEIEYYGWHIEPGEIWKNDVVYVKYSNSTSYIITYRLGIIR